MTINNSQFTELLENLPLIEVSLDWDGEEGQGTFEGHEMTSGNFIVFADFNVFETGTIDGGDYFTGPSFTSHGHSSDVHGVDVFDNDGEEVKLNPEQSIQITKKIESLISTL